MILKFINREKELEFLEQRYKHRGFEFFVIYGRRRVGKTELIKNFIKGKPHIYLLCDKSGTERNTYRLKKKIAQYLNEPLIATNDLEEISSYLIKKSQEKTKEKIVIVFDEFSYLMEKDPAIPSTFQAICDEILKNSNVFLILCGSSISMMEKGVLSSKSPLYGRKTAHIKLNPIEFKHFKEFFPLNNIEKNIEFYAILGGVPFYLEKFSDKKTSLDNIKEQILSKEGKLYEEIEFLLKEELREPDVYKAILYAIASGNTRLVDISNKSGIRVQDIDKYLKVLINLGIIKKEIPVTRVKSKKSMYLIADNFFDFYFSFVEPYKSDLEIGETKNAENNLRLKFNTYMGRKFEKLIGEEIIRKLGIMQIQKVGRWWGYHRENGERKTIEIDIVALNERTKEILFGECKWQGRVNAKKVVKELADKAQYVDWRPGNGRQGRRREYFAVFAKSFSRRIDEFEGRKVYCFDLRDLDRVLRRS